MGFRFRKSFKIAPGVRVNVGKKSIGISAGVKGARVSVNSSGRKTTTVGIPGTGLSYQKTEKIGGTKKAQTGGFDACRRLTAWSLQISLPSFPLPRSRKSQHLKPRL